MDEHKLDKCPNCGMRFSDWFVWPDPKRHMLVRYCYPCGPFRNRSGVYTEYGDLLGADK